VLAFAFGAVLIEPSHAVGRGHCLQYHELAAIHPLALELGRRRSSDRLRERFLHQVCQCLDLLQVEIGDVVWWPWTGWNPKDQMSAVLETGTSQCQQTSGSRARLLLPNSRTSLGIWGIATLASFYMWLLFQRLLQCWYLANPLWSRGTSGVLYQNRSSRSPMRCQKTVPPF
jgi:hypothetical protein